MKFFVPKIKISLPKRDKYTKLDKNIQFGTEFFKIFDYLASERRKSSVGPV